MAKLYLNWKSKESCKGECESMKEIDQTFSRQSSGSSDRRGPGLGHAEVGVVDEAQPEAEFPVNFEEDETLPENKGCTIISRPQQIC